MINIEKIKQQMLEDARIAKEREKKKELGISLDGIAYLPNGKPDYASFHKSIEEKPKYQYKKQCYYSPCSIHI